MVFEYLGRVYPYVFLSYAIARIFGPATRGVLYDFTNSFSIAINITAAISLVGTILFLFNKNKEEKITQEIKKAVPNEPIQP